MLRRIVGRGDFYGRFWLFMYFFGVTTLKKHLFEVHL